MTFHPDGPEQPWQAACAADIERILEGTAVRRTGIVKETLKYARQRLDEIAESIPDPDLRPSVSKFWAEEGADKDASLVVRTLLATPSGTAEVERVFSDGGRVVSSVRTGLRSSSVERLVVLSCFMRLPNFTEYYLPRFKAWLLEKVPQYGVN